MQLPDTDLSFREALEVVDVKTGLGTKSAYQQTCLHNADRVLACDSSETAMTDEHVVRVQEGVLVSVRSL